METIMTLREERTMRRILGTIATTLTIVVVIATSASTVSACIWTTVYGSGAEAMFFDCF
jgi:hypothetical protein